MSTYPARTTVYRGITMRSRTEAEFARWLDASGFMWQYEPKAFASPEGQYLPDFRLDALHVFGYRSACPAFVEVKPDSWPNSHVDAQELGRRMWITRESELAMLVLAQPKGPCLLLRMMNGSFAFASATWSKQMTSAGPPGLAVNIAERLHPWAGEWWAGAAERPADQARRALREHRERRAG